MVLTVTLNPMLDKTVAIDRLRRGEIHRASNSVCVVGGKGVNVSRQLKRFGVETVATGLLGGEVGSQLVRLLTAEGLQHGFYRIAGMTREGVTYREADGTWTAIFEPPHEVTVREEEEFLLHCSRLLTGASWVVCSGSSPCAQTDGTYTRIIAEAEGAACQSYLDSYGQAFREGLKAKPTVAQCNRAELSSTLGAKLDTETQLLGAMEAMVNGGISKVIVTDGPRPAYAADGEEMIRIVPPSIAPVNPTGSGDCLVAGVLRELVDGKPFASAVLKGIAAGAVNATRWDIATVTIQEVEEIIPRIRIEHIS